MKRILLPFVILFSVIFLCASCLDDENDTEFIFADDTAISAFSLGTLNRYTTVKSSTGEDSTVVVAVTGSKYKFYIDQIKREIYNADSLPVGTDNKHVVCEITSKNSGVIVIKDIDSDTLRYYSSSDSIDFSEPREISVFDMAGTGRRTYKVSVNVHKEHEDTVYWNMMGTEPELARLTAMKAVENNGRIFVFGTDGRSTQIYYTDAADGHSWTPATPNFNMIIESADYSNVAVKDGMIYMLCGRQLLKSADAQTWEKVSDVSGVARLVGAGSRRLYALDGNGGMVSSEDGAAWTAETLDGDARMLPDADISFAVMPLRTNSQSEHVIMTGNHARMLDATDTTAVVWSKVEEYAPNSEVHAWTYYDNVEKNALPRLENLVMTCYDGRLAAFGGDGMDGGKATAFSQMYFSNDNGLSWHNDTRFGFPKDFSSSKSSFAFTAGPDNFLWIICGETGQVWRGRLSQLGWANDRTSFTKSPRL